MTNLQPSGSRIPEAWFIKRTFSLRITTHLTKPQNRTKKSLTQLTYHTIALSKGTIFVKKMLVFCKKKSNISKIKGVLVLKGIFSETTYVCVITYRI